MNWLNIIEYRPEHQPYFEALNRAWIEKYFEVEPVDEFMLRNPEEAIIKNGGAILMAEYNGVIAGTVALRKVNSNTYEFTKMAVNEEFRRKGIAEKLSYNALKKAIKLKGKEVILYSHSSLKPAIALYEKIGFKPTPVDPGTYKRADVKMIINLNNIPADRMNLSLNSTNHKLMSVKIIKADESYAAAIASLGKRSFREAFECHFNKKEELRQYLEYTFDSEKIYRSILKQDNVYYVALSDEVPVGFIKVKKFSLNSQIPSESQMELQKLYVLCEHHGTGAGPALMRAVLQLAKEIQPDYVWLDTLITNVRAIHFYEKRGFKKTGKLSFQIGTQIFNYHLMALPVAVTEALQLDLKTN